MLVFEVGGGLELEIAPRTFLRLDIGDRAVKYPGPAFDENLQFQDDDFFGHDLRFAIGGGFRFGN